MTSGGAQWRALTPAQVADVVGRLGQARWSWAAGDIDQLAAQLRWPVDSRPTGSLTYLRTGYPVNGGIATVSLGGSIGEEAVLVLVIDPWPRRFPERTDAFAMAATAAAGTLGEPADRRPGPYPEVRWAAASGTLRVVDNGTAVGLELLSPRYAAWWDSELARELDEGRSRAASQGEAGDE